MTINTYIAEKREPVRKAILEFLDHKYSANGTLHYYREALDKLKRFVPEGKLLRGILTVFAYEMCHGKGVRMEDIAAAMEFNQSSLLIHDDIMDQDTMRRGSKTLYAEYMDDASHVMNPLLYGQSMAMCVADIGFFLAFELLVRSGVDAAVITEIVSEIQLVGGAQMSDVHLGQSTDEPGSEEIMNVYRYKTGRYTFALPLKVGAMAAGADAEVVKLLEKFGETLGIIFQLRDDEIKLFGSNQSTGASIGSDIRENKKTIMRHILYTQASPTLRKRLDSVFGNPDITDAEVDEVKRSIETLGVLDRIHQDMQHMITTLQEALTALPVDPAYKTLLQEFVTYNVTRTK